MQTISRARELAEIGRAFAQHRLVTLHGPGGAGKTWLARQLTPDEFVEVTESLTGVPPGDLVVLDGAERALDVCAALAADLLARHADLRIVVTSTEVLDVPGERVVLVTPYDDSALELTEAAPRQHARLLPDERVLLRRLCVCPEFDLDLAVAVAASRDLPAPRVPHALEGLVAKALVLPADPYRFRLLPAVRALASIELAAAGEADQVAARLRGLPSQPPPADPPLDPALTERQHEVLTLVAAGLTNAAIAAELGITERTVDHHVGHMLTRLGLRTRTQLAVWARR